MITVSTIDTTAATWYHACSSAVAVVSELREGEGIEAAAHRLVADDAERYAWALGVIRAKGRGGGLDAQAVALLSCSTTAGKTVGELRCAGRVRTNSAAARRPP